MAFERTEDVERGLRLIPNLVEVMPERADESVLEVYESETSPQERYTYLYLPRWRVQGNLPFLDTIETNRGLTSNVLNPEHWKRLGALLSNPFLCAPRPTGPRCGDECQQ